MEQSDDNNQGNAISGYFVPAESHRNSSGPRLIDIRNLVRKFRWLLIGGPVVGAAIMLSISFLMVPKYRVLVLLAPVETSASGNALASLGGAISSLGALAGVSVGGNSNRNEFIAILASKALTTGFIQEQELLPVLFADEWDEKEERWRTMNEMDIPTIEDGYRFFNQDIRNIVTDRETGLVTLSITWSHRGQAANWANQLVDRANAVIRKRAIDEYERSIEYLNQELENTTVLGVRSAIYRVIEGQIEQVTLANVRNEYAFQVLDPAVAPDVEDTVFPSRPLFAFAGLILGFAFAATVALIRLR